MIRTGGWRLALAALLLLWPALPAAAQQKVERISFHSAALEGNLEGNSVERRVFVILPPSYSVSPQRRYPVLYFLHGFTDSAEKIMRWIRLAEGSSAAISKGSPELIVIVPDSESRHGGGMYSNSPTVGNFEDYIARDLVAHIDRRYRTIAKRESRGLAGHSMGGYGTLRIGMRHPDVFSSIYAMSACCLSPRTITPEAGKAIEGLSMEQVLKGDFMVKANYAAAAAWSPAPEKPPFFLDIGTREGVVQPLVVAKWAANAPIAMIPQYVANLKSLTAIAMDVGDDDFLLRDNVAMHEELLRYGVKHQYTLYDGDHGNRIAQRYQDLVVPFFGRHLKGQ